MTYLKKHALIIHIVLTFVNVLLFVALFPSMVKADEVPTIVTYRPTSALDETRRNCNNVGCTLFAFFTGNVAMGETSSSSFDYRSHIVFRNVEIPQGAQINSATLTLVGASFAGSGGSRTAHIYGDYRDTAIPPTDEIEFDAIQKTTANVNWPLSTTTWVGNTFVSPDITTIIQEIIDRPLWEADNDMGIFWGDFTDGFQFARLLTAVPTIGSGNEPILTIEYVQIVTPTSVFSGWNEFLGSGITIALVLGGTILTCLMLRVPFAMCLIFGLLGMIFLWVAGIVSNTAVLTTITAIALVLVLIQFRPSGSTE